MQDHDLRFIDRALADGGRFYRFGVWLMFALAIGLSALSVSRGLWAPTLFLVPWFGGLGLLFARGARRFEVSRARVRDAIADHPDEVVLIRHNVGRDRYGIWQFHLIRITLASGASSIMKLDRARVDSMLSVLAEQCPRAKLASPTRRPARA